MKSVLKNNRFTEYDVIVIGAGQSGCEAALASARDKSKTLVLNISLDSIGIMPLSNTAGGFIKSGLLKEIDILGSEITRNVDRTFINIKTMKDKIEKAPETLRAVVDKRKYFINMKKVLDNQENLDSRQGLVVDIEKNRNTFSVRTSDGISYKCRSAVISTGTFLNGKIFWGSHNLEAGRQGEINSKRFPLNLEKIGFKFRRARVYSSPALDGKTIDFNRIKPQKFDKKPAMFSYNGKFDGRIQLKNYETCMEKKHIKEIFPFSGLNNNENMVIIEEFLSKYYKNYEGRILVQPEGYDTGEMYLDNLPMFFSEEEQLKIIKNFKGLENAAITRPGYGIEYSILAPFQVNSRLESTEIEGMFFAGNINGTSGYEESASQGIMAGINASRFSKIIELIDIKEDYGYLGLLLNGISPDLEKMPYGIADLEKRKEIDYNFPDVYEKLINIMEKMKRKDEIREIEKKYRRFMKNWKT